MMDRPGLMVRGGLYQREASTEKTERDAVWTQAFVITLLQVACENAEGVDPP